MTDNQRNDGLHPRHPGRGKTSLIELEGDKIEQGGFLIFLPSGRTKVIAWTTAKPITPTIDACKDYTAKVLQQLIDGDTSEDRFDFDRVNWTSVAAAVQRIIMDFNDKLMAAINGKMAKDLILPPGSSRRLH